MIPIRSLFTWQSSPLHIGKNKTIYKDNSAINHKSDFFQNEHNYAAERRFNTLQENSEDSKVTTTKKKMILCPGQLPLK